MQYSPISQNEWEALYSCAGDANRIRARCVRLVEDIAKVFSTPDVESVGLGITVEGDSPHDVIAHINSPVAEGRLRVEWGISDGALAGIVKVERKTLTPEDKCIWLPVWGITVPSRGNPYVGAGDGKFQVHYDQNLGAASNQSLFACGMSMLYAIAVKSV